MLCITTPSASIYLLSTIHAKLNTNRLRYNIVLLLLYSHFFIDTYKSFYIFTRQHKHKLRLLKKPLL